MSPRALLGLAFIPSALFAATPPSAGPAAPQDGALAESFTRGVRPFVQTYCVSCHGKDKPEAELDLTPYPTVQSVIEGFGHWEIVLERLEAAEMPPDDEEKQPSAKERAEIIAWIHALRESEANKNAGDPGPVLARRLNNAEYDYTIRDLTGVDIRPTRAFPVDPANQAGFDNSGESLSMSPALVKKYLGAAREVADHLILQPEGFTFAPHPVVADTDRDKYFVLKIVDFYRRQPTDLADYFAAAWRYQHRAVLGQPDASLARVAVEAKISPHYLETVWRVLSDGKDDVGPIAKLRQMWRDQSSPRDHDAVAASRARAEAMRDYVNGLRVKLVPDVRNLSAPQIQGGSRPSADSST
jgi:mono/diheme cytochrome c family protein